MYRSVLRTLSLTYRFSIHVLQGHRESRKASENEGQQPISPVTTLNPTFTISIWKGRQA